MSLCSEVLGNQSCENGVYFIPVRVSKMLDTYLILTLLITGHDFVAYSHNENIRLYIRDSYSEDVILAFWVVMPRCLLDGCQHLRGTYFLLLQGEVHRYSSCSDLEVLRLRDFCL
jgi:hypothetical protein